MFLWHQLHVFFPFFDADEEDYTPIRFDSLQVSLFFSDSDRRSCFNVAIIDDNLDEDTEEFSIELRFDPVLPPPDLVTIEPGVTFVQIEDTTRK